MVIIVWVLGRAMPPVMVWLILIPVRVMCMVWSSSFSLKVV